MNIKVLIENKESDKGLSCEHGLSLYIELKNEENSRKLLMDFGASEKFAENAKKMKVDLSQIDMAVLSHGHYDHGGGLPEFLELNSKAKVYVNDHAFGNYYSLLKPIESIENWNRKQNPPKYIGIDKSLQSHRQLNYVGNQLKVDKDILLYSAIKGDRFNPTGNKRLLMKNYSDFEHDTFSHEQNMIISEGENHVLFAGCAHSGIVNSIEEARKRFDINITHVVSGLHLYNKKSDLYEKDEVVKGIGQYFIDHNISVYTGHCTGEKAYLQLKEMMGDKMNSLNTGTKITIASH